MIPSELELVANGDRRALSRLLTRLVDAPDAADLKTLSTHTPVHVTGLTGPPGAGKSTLVDQLIRFELRQGGRPGVVVIDPSSPLTGGALLGDRIRMQEHSADEAVFIRSMATRGILGGLAGGVEPVLSALYLGGFSPLFVETVGVGQSEIEIVRVARTVVVVLHPGWGDDVQAAKAGLLEVADVIFVNKSDLGGGDRAAGQLKRELALGEGRGWSTPILVGSALIGEGIEALAAAVSDHQDFLKRPPAPHPTRPGPQPAGPP